MQEIQKCYSRTERTNQNSENMKSRQEIETRIKALVLQMKDADKMKHAKIRGAIAALEWVIGELEDIDKVVLDPNR